jgi:hypothetical protein
MDKSTSDEKLLKLIEGTANIKPSQKLGLKSRSKGLFPFAFSFPVNPLKIKFVPLANLPNINKGLFVVCALLTLWFLVAIVTGAQGVKADLIFPTSKGAGIAKGINQEGNNFLGLQDYLGEINKRNIFLGANIRASAEKQIAPDVIMLVQDLRLVGIIWSKNPEAMVESVKDAKTYLVKKGDTVSQQLRIKEVTRNSVILEKEIDGQMQQVELR